MSVIGVSVRVLLAMLFVWVPCFFVGLLIFTPQLPTAGRSELVGTSAWIAGVAAITVGIPAVVTYLVLHRT